MNVPELIAAASKNDLAAQKKLYDMYYEECFTFCNMQVKNRHDAEHLLSVSFQCFFVKLHLFEYMSERSPVTWLKKIIGYECRQHRKQKGKWILVEDEMAMEIIVTEDPLDNIGERELLDMVMTLREEHSAVFMLSAVEELSHNKIAKLLGITEVASRIYLLRARKELQILIHHKTTQHAT